jgi:hypothetical protein
MAFVPRLDKAETTGTRLPTAGWPDSHPYRSKIMAQKAAGGQGSGYTEKGGAKASQGGRGGGGKGGSGSGNSKKTGKGG